MTIELQGATALVTGAGSGIGRETALALAREGAHVHVVDIDAEGAAKTAADTGGEAHVVDVSDADAVRALAEQVGALDVLVNNAGVGMTGRFLDTPLDDWRWIRSINLDGVLHCCHAFGPAMLERGRGHVVNVSSGLGYTPRATEPAYVTTKAGVLAFSQCLRADWRSQGVGVSAICPGVINTPIIDKTKFHGAQADPKKRQRTIKTFRRGHSPEKVAAAILDAVQKDKAVVAVGWEAKLGWGLHRVAPLRFQQFVARQDVG